MLWSVCVVYPVAMTERRPTDDAGSSREDGPSDGDADRASEDAGRSSEERSAWSASHGSLSDNLIFASVDSPRRRFILEALVEEGGAADVDELVDDLVAIEQQADADDITDHEELLQVIYDRDLPDLSDIGVVDLDESSGTVELGPYADELDIEEFTPDPD